MTGPVIITLDIPGSMDEVAAAAQALGTAGPAYRNAGEQTHMTWQRLSAYYRAPEAAMLFAATAPVAKAAVEVGTHVRDTSNVLNRFAETVRQLQRQLADLKAAAAAFNASLPPAAAFDMDHADPPDPMLTLPTSPSLSDRLRDKQAADLENAATALATSYLSVQKECAAGIVGVTHAAAMTVAVNPTLSALGGQGDDGLKPPPPENDPTNTAIWWKSLSAEQQRLVADKYPYDLGRANGVPGAVRSDANERLLAEAMQSPIAEVRVNAHAVMAAMVNASKQIDPITGKPVEVQLLIFEPNAFGGDGRAAIAVGNVDTADNVAVLVPGTANDVAGMTANVGSAFNLYQEARMADGTRGTAVIAWMGYDAPSGTDVHSVAFEGAADEGGRLLTSDINGITAARGDHQPRVTVIGHSYGSLTVGKAFAEQGLRADAVSVLGSPGTAVDRAVDLHMPADRVFIGSASADPVSYLERFGTDPANGTYGGIRFQAENLEPFTDSVGFNDHLHYLDRKSESLYNLSQIVTGKYGSVRTAYPRYYVLEMPTDAAETFRPPANPTNGPG